MLHPQDFVSENGMIDEKKYREYINILVYFKGNGYSIVRFSDLLEDQPNIKNA
jgi:hypothetical protein